MTSITDHDEPEFPAIFGRLRDLERGLVAQGVNKHERARVLINACIAEGINTGSRILGTLKALDFEKGQIAIILGKGVQREPVGSGWGRDENGLYYVPAAV